MFNHIEGTDVQSMRNTMEKVEKPHKYWIHTIKNIVGGSVVKLGWPKT